MLKIIISIVTFVSLCLLLLLLNITTPATAGPFGILVIFILAYMSSFGLMAFFLYFMGRILSHLSRVFMTRKPLNTLTFKHSCLFSSVIAAAPIMLIGLRSVGEMGFYEYLLIFIFTVIGCLYISKRTY
jgi:hypothetical protein